jgi:hypothetical protein
MSLFHHDRGFWEPQKVEVSIKVRTKYLDMITVKVPLREGSDSPA